MENKLELPDISTIEPNTFGDVCLRKQRRKRQKLLIVDLLYDFAKNSTLHGLRNIIDTKLSLIERVFWFVTFVMSVCMCFYLMSNVWVKWRTSPVIVTVNEQLVSVGKVPFPSVTICSQSKCNWDVYNYTYQYKRYFNESNDSFEIPEEDAGATKFDDISVVCEYDRFYTDFYLHRNKTNVTLVQNIMEVSDEFFFENCMWRNYTVGCRDLFKPVLTREGLCYNMNALAANEMFWNESIQHEYAYSSADHPSKGWSMDKGYYTFDPEAYPKRGRESSAIVDLSISLIEERINTDKLCNKLNSGYKIYLHHPADMAQSSMYYYSGLPSTTTALAINMNILNTSDSLRQYAPETRQCYFPGERPLRYFRIYTANNCRIECLSNITFAECQCVWFHMPHNDSAQLCTNAKKECVRQAAEMLAEEEQKLISGSNNSACQCLPACDSVEYDAEVLKTEYNIKTAIKVEYDVDVDEWYQFSKVQLYFKKPRYVSMRRSELFGATDFLANCGGLLGLFLGFSFLSLVEIFYYLTLRIGCILKKDLQDEKMEPKLKESKLK